MQRSLFVETTQAIWNEAALEALRPGQNQGNHLNIYEWSW